MRLISILVFYVVMLVGVWCDAQPYQQPPVYAVGYQPVLVPGDYIVVPRILPCLDFVFGPRLYFVPRPQQYPGPVQPQQQPLPPPQR